jgi:glycosyltransferase involved in cell wall biosynthesis
MHTPKISIITVTFNAEKIIEKTIQSVLAQTYPNIEYIIVDGLSKDNTLEIVATYKDRIATIISEKDKNNYDAMNKGLALATGDYVWFLHAGDYIPQPDTLEKALLGANYADFVYGDAEIYTEKGEIIPFHKKTPSPIGFSWRTLRTGMLICHQSMLMKRSIAVKYDFETYRVAADLDWTIRSLKGASSYHYAGVKLCAFLAGGISNQHRKQGLWERFRILFKHFGFWITLWEHIKIFFQATKRGTISNH